MCITKLTLKNKIPFTPIQTDHNQASNDVYTHVSFNQNRYFREKKTLQRLIKGYKI